MYIFSISFFLCLIVPEFHKVFKGSNLRGQLCKSNTALSRSQGQLMVTLLKICCGGGSALGFYF